MCIRDRYLWEINTFTYGQFAQIFDLPAYSCSHLADEHLYNLFRDRQFEAKNFLFYPYKGEEIAYTIYF